MKNRLKTWLDAHRSMEPLPPTDPVLIYGAGSKGRQIAAFLRTHGHNVVGLADISATGTEFRDGFPLRRIADWQVDRLFPDFTIVVAVHNHQVDMTDLLRQLEGAGARRIVNPVEFQMLFQDTFPPAYWLSGPSAYDGASELMESVGEMLADEESRHLLSRVLEFRLTGRYAVLPSPSPFDQYAPGDLPRWPEPLRLIDGGAFDGDTIRHFRRMGYAFDQIAAFEPDPGNFKKLAAYVAGIGTGICLPCGLAQSACQMHFRGLGTGASQLVEDGDILVQCVAIDEALANFRPNLIKMDIEGAEPEALLGARNVIGTHRPGLAISVYHQPAHLWRIPLLINDWRLDYRLHLRMHGYSSFDLVLYGIPL